MKIGTFHFAEYSITLSKRFLSLKTGVWSEQINDILLSKKQGVQVYQTFLGKQLHYGTLRVSTGEISQTYFIENPMEFRKSLLENAMN